MSTSLAIAQDRLLSLESGIIELPTGFPLMFPTYWWTHLSGISEVDGKIHEWKDVRQGKKLLQSIQANKPEIDGNEIVFSGNQFFSVETPFSLSQPAYIFIVWNITNNSNHRAAFAFNGSSYQRIIWLTTNNIQFRSSDGNQILLYPKTAPFDYMLHTAKLDTTARLYENGVFQGQLTFGTITTSEFLVGVAQGGSSGFLHGKIKEILIYETELTLIEKNRIELFLMNKHAL